MSLRCALDSDSRSHHGQLGRNSRDGWGWTGRIGSEWVASSGGLFVMAAEIFFARFYTEWGSLFHNSFCAGTHVQGFKLPNPMLRKRLAMFMLP